MPLLLRQQGDVNINDVPLDDTTARAVGLLCGRSGQWCHVHSGIRQQSCDAGLPRTAPPGLCYDAGWHAQRQARLQCSAKERANPRVPALKCE